MNQKLFIMKLLLMTILSTTCGLSKGFCPGKSTGRPSRATTPWSFRQPPACTETITALHALGGKVPSSADALLKMVEEISDDQFSPEVVAKVAELEKVLIAFLDDESEKKDPLSPRPPGTPPPLNAFDQFNQQQEQNSLFKAEEALEKLRQRLQEEEDALLMAEEALKRSLEEEEVLRKAEEALQKSRVAAKKRKADVIRRTEVARALAQEAREEAAKQNVLEDAFEPTQGRGTIAINKPRQKTPLASLSAEDGEDNLQGGADEISNSSGKAPAGIPTLYNWVQYVDGSITGRIKDSRNFIDGATVSTSPVPAGAKGGNVITTASGSRYFLEMPPKMTLKKARIQATPKTSQAPAGVPSIVNWELQEDGGIGGLVYGSPNAEDGDYVETSPIANGRLESGRVVETTSGSLYFLSPTKEEKDANTMAAFKDLAAAKKGGTITITKEMKERQAEKAMKVLSQAKPRSTFSLRDLFGRKRSAKKRVVNGKNAPSGVPTLLRWNVNDDGTITGIISGSPNIDDGDLVTTSPIARGKKRRFETVKTVSGSSYFLGE